MNRRNFLFQSAATAAGIVVVNDLEILERLLWRRRLFLGAAFPRTVLVTPSPWPNHFGVPTVHMMQSAERLKKGDVVYFNSDGRVSKKGLYIPYGAVIDPDYKFS